MAAQWWWGTYPEAGLGAPSGQGEGLWHQVAGAADAELAIELGAPSFVVAHPDLPLLYACLEEDPSSVVAVDVSDPSAPAEVGRVATVGNGACHMLLSDDTLVLYVAHYGSGDVAVVRLGADGTFDSDKPAQLLGHSGTGPRADRQEGPHAHYVGYAPGRRHLLVADLGTDELRRYAIGADGALGQAGIAATLPPGSGPRHFAVSGQLIYLVCELDHHLRTLRWDGESATAEVIAELPTTTAPHRTGDTVYDAHVVLVDDALLVSVRGADVIAVFDLSPEGEARYRASFDVGYWPRHFAVTDERLVVGCEKGHEVRWYDLAAVLGLPPEAEVSAVAELPHESAKVLSPACICPR